MVVQPVISRVIIVFWKCSVLDYETFPIRNFCNSNQISIVDPINLLLLKLGSLALACANNNTSTN